MRWRKSLIVVLTVLACCLSAGCEFLVSFETVPGGTTTGGAGGTSGSTAGGGGTTTTSGCDPATCPAPADECRIAVCNANDECGEKAVEDGMPSQTQVAGDCLQNVCTGGVVGSQNDDADLPGDLLACTIDLCASGVASHELVAAGTMCAENGGAVCDGNGACVECLVNLDCLDAQKPACDSTAHVCIALTCLNGSNDVNETDVDCGGLDCAPCDLTKSCLVNTDCKSNVCFGDPLICVECASAADCPASGTECAVAACDANVCGATNVPQGYVLADGQTTGDCQVLVCDGAGGTTSMDDATDLPVPTTVCVVDPACVGAPLTPSLTPEAAGADCTADNEPPKKVCGGGLLTGACVECNTDADCDVVLPACIEHVCN